MDPNYAQGIVALSADQPRRHRIADRSKAGLATLHAFTPVTDSLPFTDGLLWSRERM